MDVGKWARGRDKLARQHPPPVLNLPVRFTVDARPAQWRLDGKQLTARRTGILRTPVDPWAIRQEFRATAGDDARLMGFLNQFGWWGEPYPRHPRDYHEFRQEIDDILLTPPGLLRTRTFLAAHLVKKDFTLRFRWERHQMLPSEVDADGIYDALCLTVHVDLLRQVEFRKCKRPDCREIYEVTSNHHREYHAQYCAHLESVRRRRRARSLNGGRSA
jgi:hypothetical protein